MKFGNQPAKPDAMTRRPGDRAPASNGGPSANAVFLRRGTMVLFLIINLVFLLSFADRDGYEGDDLNAIAPMFHLDEAKNGEIDIYRYAWQPLSYELGAAVFRITGSPDAIFLLAPLAATISISMLLMVIWDKKPGLDRLVFSLLALLAIPELWYSGLYFNSTIIGMPFAVAALATLIRSKTDISTIFAGMLIVVSILMRLDFVLTAPALAVASWQADRSLRRPVLLATTVLLTLALFSAMNVLDLTEVVEIYRNASSELVRRSQEPGWDFQTKIFVMSVALSPIGWVILVLGGFLVLKKHSRSDPLLTLLWLLAIMPLLMPARNLLSIKYLLPLFVFAPLFLKLCLEEVRDRFSGLMRPVIVASLALGTAWFFLFSISLSGGRPFIEIGALAARPIGTHDGLRSYGGYLWQMAVMDVQGPQRERRRIAHEIHDEALQPDGPDLLLAGDETFFSPGSIGWRHLQLALERSGFRGAVVARGTVLFDIGDRRLILTSVKGLDSLLSSYDRGTGVKLYDFRRDDAQ